MKATHSPPGACHSRGGRRLWLCVRVPVIVPVIGPPAPGEPAATLLGTAAFLPQPLPSRPHSGSHSALGRGGAASLARGGQAPEPVLARAPQGRVSPHFTDGDRWQLAQRGRRVPTTPASALPSLLRTHLTHTPLHTAPVSALRAHETPSPPHFPGITGVTLSSGAAPTMLRGLEGYAGAGLLGGGGLLPPPVDPGCWAHVAVLGLLPRPMAAGPWRR